MKKNPIKFYGKYAGKAGPLIMQIIPSNNRQNYMTVITNPQSNSAQTNQVLNTAAAVAALSQYSPLGNVNIKNSPQRARSVVYTLTANSTTPTYFIIMGNKSIADQALGVTTLVPTNCSDGLLGANLNNYISSGGTITLNTCIYTAGTGLGIVQFALPFVHISGDFDADTKKVSIIPAVAQNPQNQNVDQLKFMSNWEITENNALAVQVTATTTVQMVFTFDAYKPS